MVPSTLKVCIYSLTSGLNVFMKAGTAFSFGNFLCYFLNLTPSALRACSKKSKSTV